MTHTVILGGARSGKSRYALHQANTLGGSRTYIATAQPLDTEMALRIERHRSERSADWETIEEPLELVRALSLSGDRNTVVVDCLTLWLSNMIESGHGDATILDETGSFREVLLARAGATFVVTNEVGSGIVPVNQDVRRYRDVLGTVNALVAEEPAECVLMVAGRPLPLGSV